MSAIKYNKGEWSELYVFIKLLKDGKVFAADENVGKIEDVYLPIIKIIREDNPDSPADFFTGDVIRIYRDGKLVKEMSVDKLAHNEKLLFEKIFSGSESESGAFQIPEIESFLKEADIRKVKASSDEKVDIKMQIRDVNTGFSPVVGFSVKSDMGNPPTLLNPGKNTRIKYRVTGLNDADISEINSIDSSVEKEYMKARMTALFERAENVEFIGIKNDTFTDNLIMIDSALPKLYGEMVLLHYRLISDGIYDCELLADILSELNPLKFNRNDVYRYKIKKMITAAALGMTPGKSWDGMEAATGGYVIIKKDGDVLCYHLYNRNYFEEYLIKNTQIDRPSASRYDYGYLYMENGDVYIDLNVQIRFKSIKASQNKEKRVLAEEESAKRIKSYMEKLQGCSNK